MVRSRTFFGFFCNFCLTAEPASDFFHLKLSDDFERVLLFPFAKLFAAETTSRYIPYVFSAGYHCILTEFFKTFFTGDWKKNMTWHIIIFDFLLRDEIQLTTISDVCRRFSLLKNA